MLWAQITSKLPAAAALKGDKNSHIVCNRDILFQVLDSKFYFLCICYSRLYLEEATTLFLFRTQMGPFWVFWGKNAVKQHQLEVKFWPQVFQIISQMQMPFEAFWIKWLSTEIGCTKSLTFLVHLWPQFTLCR